MQLPTSMSGSPPELWSGAKRDAPASSSTPLRKEQKKKGSSTPSATAIISTPAPPGVKQPEKEEATKQLPRASTSSNYQNESPLLSVNASQVSFRHQTASLLDATVNRERKV